MGPARPARPVHRLAHVRGPQLQGGALHDDRAGPVRHALEAAHGPAQHLGPQRPALDLVDPRVLDAAGAHPGDQVRDRGGHHARLAQGGQHLLHVAQEGPRGAHQQHARALQAGALGVEQVGDPVQGHGRLARAGAALDDEHAPGAGGDDAVLLGLDGGDDIAHAPVAGRAHGGDEGALALEFLGRRAGPGGPALAQGPHVDDLVLEPDDAAAAGVDVTTAHQPHRVRGGRLVEGPRQGGPPVQDDLPAARVLQPGAPHVVAPSGPGAPGPGGVGGQVHAPEDEPVLDPLQGGDEPGVVGGVGVPLAAGLVGAAGRARLRGGQGGARRLQPAVELAVGPVHHLLLGGYLSLPRRGGAGARGRALLGGGGVLRMGHWVSLVWEGTRRPARCAGEVHYSPRTRRAGTPTANSPRPPSAPRPAPTRPGREHDGRPPRCTGRTGPVARRARRARKKAE